MKLILLGAFALFLLFSSCKKKSEISIVIAGDPLGMDINTYDYLIARTLYKTSFEIDVNNDQVNDFRLVSFNLSGTAMGVSPQNGSSLVCQHNNATVLCSLETDTLFAKKQIDTIVEGSKVRIYWSFLESCADFGPSDSIKKIWDQNKPLVKRAGESITIDERAVADSMTLTRISYGTIMGQIYHNQDTTIYVQFAYLDECNTMINDTAIYFGIRIGERPGWIKLRIFDNYKILLVESAIAKE